MLVYLPTLPDTVDLTLLARPTDVIGPREVRYHVDLTEAGRTAASRVKHMQSPVDPLASACDRVVRLCGEPRTRKGRVGSTATVGLMIPIVSG